MKSNFLRKILAVIFAPKKCKTLVYSMVNPAEILIEDEEILDEYLDYFHIGSKVYLYKFNLWVANSDAYMVQMGEVYPAVIRNGKIYKK